MTAELQTVNETLEKERASGCEKDTEIETLKGMLEKEKQHMKRHWRERCKQLMAHEEALEEKDVEIMSLKFIADLHSIVGRGTVSYFSIVSTKSCPKSYFITWKPGTTY